MYKATARARTEALEDTKRSARQSMQFVFGLPANDPARIAAEEHVRREVERMQERWLVQADITERGDLRHEVIAEWDAIAMHLRPRRARELRLSTPTPLASGSARIVVAFGRFGTSVTVSGPDDAWVEGVRKQLRDLLSGQRSRLDFIRTIWFLGIAAFAVIISTQIAVVTVAGVDRTDAVYLGLLAGSAFVAVLNATLSRVWPAFEYLEQGQKSVATRTAGWILSAVGAGIIGAVISALFVS
ncbi:hypothetical protein AB6N24_14255 [Cellulomonas sp. 179-A 4D5 NHS]|uniref:hypothetical protein n=1 Tax=Cellulomonas sp. 179-A 4D5 NHS TaxID=3142378 RepID=UPI0039A2A659